MEEITTSDNQPPNPEVKVPNPPTVKRIKKTKAKNSKKRVFKQVVKPLSPRYARERWDEFLGQDQRGMLCIEQIPVDRIIAKYGTPVYVMVESEIRKRLRRFKKVFPNFGLQYAVKCNSNLEILRIVREEGFELDCSSVGELILGLLADFKPNQLTFTNLYKTSQDIHFATKIGVQSITADSFEDIRAIASTAKKLRKHIDMVIRVNPMIEMGNYSTKGNKYGIPIQYIKKAIELAKKSPYIDFQGFHFMGGYVKNPRVFKAALRAMLKLIKWCNDRRIRIKSVSLGGGFPAAIGDETAFKIESMADFPAYFEKLLIKSGVQPFRLIFEPGKSIVLNAGMGLMKVVSRKRLGKSHRMVIADGSSYNFIPDAVIQEGIEYDILPASNLNKRRTQVVTIAGNTCDCWDIIRKGIMMPKLQAGDILAAMDVGAYAQVMSSNFNNIKRAPMIMVYADGTMKQIRRRDRYSEMFAPELDVLKFASSEELEKYHNLYRVNIDKIWKDNQPKKNWLRSRRKKA